MVRSMYTGATGMEAQQLYMDTISHNLANVNTNSYKRSKIEFQDLLYQTLKEPGVRNAEGGMSPAGIQVGLGVKAAAVQRIFEQGSLTPTENPLDLMIGGEGFYQLAMPDGSMAFTRDGSFKLSSEGMLVTSNGVPLYPQIVIPQGAQSFTVDNTGKVSVVLPGEEASTEIGQIELARFVNPAGLRAQGDNLYYGTDASGEAVLDTPGSGGMGTIQQGYVEASNVQIVQEMVSMITAQRAYEIVSKSIQVSEDMLQIANNLKR